MASRRLICKNILALTGLANGSQPPLGGGRTIKELSSHTLERLVGLLGGTPWVGSSLCYIQPLRVLPLQPT